MWEKLDDTKLQLDEDELEMYFGKPLSKEQPKTQSAINLTNEVKKKEPIKLLGSDRWRNMEIVLTKLKLPDGVIAQALTECSGKYANFNVLESIVKLLPT